MAITGARAPRWTEICEQSPQPSGVAARAGAAIGAGATHGLRRRLRRACALQPADIFARLNGTRWAPDSARWRRRATGGALVAIIAALVYAAVPIELVAPGVGLRMSSRAATGTRWALGGPAAPPQATRGNLMAITAAPAGAVPIDSGARRAGVEMSRSARGAPTACAGIGVAASLAMRSCGCSRAPQPGRDPERSPASRAAVPRLAPCGPADVLRLRPDAVCAG